MRLRRLPETRARAQRLAGTAGACRWVWNHFLAHKQQAYAAYQDGKRSVPPHVSAYGMFVEFTALRRNPDYAWLPESSCAEVRYALKHLADAYRAFFAGHGQYPRFKARHRTQDGFTIADDVSISHGHLRVPRIGGVQLKGANPYTDCTPVQARIKREGTRVQPKGYACVVYAVPADQARWAWTATWGRRLTVRALCIA